jgi:hypothetical protein
LDFRGRIAGEDYIGDEIHNLYASQNIRVIKSRRITWMGHVACMGDEKWTQSFGW